MWDSGVMMNDLGQSPQTPHQPIVMQMSQTMCIKLWHWVTLGNVSFIGNLSVAITEEGNKKKWHKIAYLKKIVSVIPKYFISQTCRNLEMEDSHIQNNFYFWLSLKIHIIYLYFELYKIYKHIKFLRRLRIAKHLTSYNIVTSKTVWIWNQFLISGSYNMSQIIILKTSLSSRS